MVSVLDEADSACAPNSERHCAEATLSSGSKGEPEVPKATDNSGVEAGKKAFEAGDYETAAERWAQSLKSTEYIKAKAPYEPGSAREQEFHDLCLKLHLNLALVSLKLNRWASAVSNAQKALEFDSRNEKALWRYMNGLIGQCCYDEAQAAADRLLEVNPNLKTVVALKEQIRRQAIGAARSEKELSRKMFPGLGASGGSYVSRLVTRIRALVRDMCEVCRRRAGVNKNA
eukprot:GEMP01075234.1.p1 GENE.GEMP01075234.1~~GEMP01075234.1.p1  ORF type:complete len:230 (+),score=53.71 GEMP01075234.1:65-754(+)